MFKEFFEKSPTQITEEKEGFYKIVIDDADYLDATDESDRALVWDRIQKDRTAKTLDTQTAVTGRSEARPVSLSGDGMQSVDEALTAMGFNR